MKTRPTEQRFGRELISMRRVGLIGVVLSLLMCSCVPYISMKTTGDLMVEEYSPVNVGPATLEEVESFLKEDTIDHRMFLPNVYDCKDFSADLWRSAYLKGFEASMVLYLHERSESNRNLAKTFYGVENPFHLVVAFSLTDGTWLYVEPQNDTTLNITEYKFRLEGGVAFDFWKRLRVLGQDGDEILNEMVEESERNNSEPCASGDLVGISFPDQNLEAAIREAVGKPTGDIYEADVANLTSLYAPERGIVALTGLEHATSLTHLYLDSNNISDISPLANLSSLTDLYLGCNEIGDISQLGNLTSLRLLRLDSNNVSDVTPLANLSGLADLYLGANRICNVSGLANLTGLTLLRLDSNQISDISPLAGLSSLTELDLGRDQIGDISPLGELTSLTDLDLHSNHISDISALVDLTSLTSLRLDSNQISDISPLLINIRLGEGDQVDLGYNPLSDSSLYTYIPELQARGVSVSYQVFAGIGTLPKWLPLGGS
jgi:hypothetical protein